MSQGSELGSCALSSCSEGGNSKETTCRPRPEPSAEIGGGAAGAANIEAARKPLAHVFTGILSRDFAKRREGKNEHRILRMKHRGRQPSFGARVGKNLENRERRAGAHPSQSSGKRAPAHPYRRARQRVRQQVGRASGRGRRVIVGRSKTAGSTAVELRRRQRQAGEKSAFPLALPSRYSRV